MLTPEDIDQKTFHLRFRGYNVDQVDDFLDRVRDELARLMDMVAQGHRPLVLRLTGKDIEEQQFKSALRGYDTGEVDAFLDEIAAEFERFQQFGAGQAPLPRAAPAPPAFQGWPPPAPREQPRDLGARPPGLPRPPAPPQAPAFPPPQQLPPQYPQRPPSPPPVPEHRAQAGPGAPPGHLPQPYPAEERSRTLGGPAQPPGTPAPLPERRPRRLTPTGQRRRLTPDEIRRRQFRSSLRGYDANEVDSFLERAADELARLEDEAAWPAREIRPRDPSQPRLRWQDVQNARFTPGIRGYDMTEVDAFLEHVAESLEQAQREALVWRGRSGGMV